MVRRFTIFFTVSLLLSGCVTGQEQDQESAVLHSSASEKKSLDQQRNAQGEAVRQKKEDEISPEALDAMRRYRERIHNCPDRDLKKEYIKKEGKLYFQDYELPGIDPDSHVAHDCNYISDKNAVYKMKVITGSMHGDDFLCGPVYFPTGVEVQKIEGTDPDTFEVVHEYKDGCRFTKDKNNVYLDDKKIDSINPQKFRYFEKHGLPVINMFREDDRLFEYSYGILTEIEGADPDSFEIIPEHNGWYARDNNHLFYHREAESGGVNYKYFELIPGSTGSTKLFCNGELGENGYYTAGKKIDGIDLDSIECVSGNFVKDKNNVYFIDEIVEGADTNTFEMINERYGKLSRDVNHVYYFGREIIDADPETFEEIGDSYDYFKDKNHVYYTFRYSEGAGKNQARKVIGADPKTFSLISVGGNNTVDSKDKNHFYYQGEPLVAAQYCGMKFEKGGVYFIVDTESESVFVPAPMIDLDTFECMRSSSEHSIFKDKNQLYLKKNNSLFLAKGADPAEFESAIGESELDEFEKERILGCGTLAEGPDAQEEIEACYSEWAKELKKFELCKPKWGRYKAGIWSGACEKELAAILIENGEKCEHETCNTKPQPQDLKEGMKQDKAEASKTIETGTVLRNRSSTYSNLPKSTCSLGSKGKNHLIRDYVSHSLHGRIYDKCLTDTYLQEISCEENSLVSSIIRCEDRCSNGSCTDNAAFIFRDVRIGVQKDDDVLFSAGNVVEMDRDLVIEADVSKSDQQQIEVSAFDQFGWGGRVTLDSQSYNAYPRIPLVKTKQGFDENIRKFVIEVSADGKSTKTEKTVVMLKKQQCLDSDGEDHQIKGVTYGKLSEYAEAPIARADYCDDDDLLIESTCSNGRLTKIEYQCPERCDNGACVRSADDRKSLKYYQKGLEHLKKSRFEQAREIFQNILEAKPLHIDARKAFVETEKLLDNKPYDPREAIVSADILVERLYDNSLPALSLSPQLNNAIKLIQYQTYELKNLSGDDYLFVSGAIKSPKREVVEKHFEMVLEGVLQEYDFPEIKVIEKSNPTVTDMGGEKIDFTLKFLYEPIGKE